MPTVRELTALYEELLIPPRHGPGVCDTCLTFTDGYAQCYVCANRPPWLDAVAPISLSVALGQLHHTLASYKRLGGEAGRHLTAVLAAILWRYLDGHEACVAEAAGARRPFDLVTSVPPRRSLSAAPADGPAPLERLVGQHCGPVRDRYARLLEPAPLLRADSEEEPEHRFDRGRYVVTAQLSGQTVLVIDDTWTTGASAQSAAAALKRAGAAAVAAVVIGRHIRRDWRENAARLRDTAAPFSWETCVHCAPAMPAALDATAGGCA